MSMLQYLNSTIIDYVLLLANVLYFQKENVKFHNNFVVLEKILRF